MALVIVPQSVRNTLQIGTHIFFLLDREHDTAISDGFVLGFIQTLHRETLEYFEKILVELPADDDVGLGADNTHLLVAGLVKQLAEIVLADDSQQTTLHHSSELTDSFFCCLVSISTMIDKRL